MSAAFRRWVVAVAVLNAVAAGWNLYALMSKPSWWRPLLVVFPAAFAVIHGRIYIKERNHGRNRQAQEDPRDPCDITVAFDPGTGNARSHYFTTFHASFTPAIGPGARVDDRGREIEHVQSDMPILAHRVARLRFDGTDRHFASLNLPGMFGTEAEATCQQGGLHWQYHFAFHGEYRDHGPAPGLNCGCGFYALPSDVGPWQDGVDLVTLLVELSGTVIEHEQGYRAQHQRVIECQVPACRYCRRTADSLLVEDGQMTSAACSAHIAPNLPTGVVVVAVDDLPDLLAVPVTSLGRKR